MKPKSTELELAFHERMKQVAAQAKELYDYPAPLFLRTIAEKGSLRAAQDWLAVRKPQEGFGTLFERGGIEGLRISMEGVIVFEPRWRELLTREEFKECVRRLEECDVPIPPDAIA